MGIGQGATEYLVLLAVVLVIALVGIALLGFFPGTASDAQITESQLYWESASPIAITEWDARIHAADAQVRPYLKIRNTGAYPVRITKLCGADGGCVTSFWAPGGELCGASSGYNSISDFYYLAPGEEKHFGRSSDFAGLTCGREIDARTTATSDVFIGGATSVCQNSSASPGMIVFKTFGFEYIQYVEGQQITKRQLGAKPLIIKCREPS